MRWVIAICALLLVGAVLLAWPWQKPQTVEVLTKTETPPVLPTWGIRRPAAPVEPPAAAVQLRYIRFLDSERMAFVDDPVAGQTWTVRTGDQLNGMTVLSVDAAAVRLQHPTSGLRVLGFEGPRPALPIQRPFPNRPEELPVVYAPGVKPDPERDRALQQLGQLRQRTPGEARLKHLTRVHGSAPGAAR